MVLALGSLSSFIIVGIHILVTFSGEKTMEGGVVNHGYVGELGGCKQNNNRAARPPSCSDSTSGYYSTGGDICFTRMDQALIVFSSL